MNTLKNKTTFRPMTIAFDFDNVIHKYRNSWGNGEIYDELERSVLLQIRDLLNMGHYVFILSTRSRFKIKHHFEYLQDTNFEYTNMINDIDTSIIPFKFETFSIFKKFWNKKYICGICNHKAVFDVLIDDRTITFNPINPPSIEDILNFKPITYI